MSEVFARNVEEKDAAGNIYHEDVVRVRVAEYKTLKYSAHYLPSNTKTLDVCGLPDVNTYCDVSTEVDGPATESIVQQELNAYSPTDFEHVTELVGQLNHNQRDVCNQVVRTVEHPVGGGNYISSMARVVLENPFFWSKYLCIFDLSAKKAIANIPHAFFLAKSKGGTDSKTSLTISDEASMMNRGFFEAVDRVVRDIMKNESEPSCREDRRQILPVLKDATRVETIAAYFERSDLAAELAKFSKFMRQTGEGRYPANEDIGEGDTCLPHA
ncbi:Helitron helicase [Phytophthora megakarya]|uniref:ATP-dependent DNA helicase n=1 Tax=Phytophthora megakarya TaxID=4795 RepID=A0A225WGX6_9STRA|nr:Helitron helicase [Phytophthora megakarya]